jgi:hypothetical protein
MEKIGIVPFTHQAEWYAATDGLVLLDSPVPPHTEGAVEVMKEDRSKVWLPTTQRMGGRARVVADLGSFKIGKSYGSALFYASFAVVPNARIQLIGLEYDICAPEFDYLCEFLLSERGMNLDAASYQNRPRDGKMWIDLKNGVRYEAKSWERKDTLKGKEIDCYGYCEAYMLPGLECYTSFSQNLRARDGFAIFPTTPDRPWLKELHDRAHSGDPRFAEWHCTCGVSSKANPFTFDQEAMERDRDLMTREKFAIHYEGKLGDFVGRVYGYQRGERTFSAATHPELFIDGRFTVPTGWEVVGGADTGTFMSAVLVMFNLDGEAFVIGEYPNYLYRSGAIELEPGITFPEWCSRVSADWNRFTGRPTAFLYADKNSQFKREAGNQRDYLIHLESNNTPLEVRTEISREYFQHNKIWFAPWLSVLPFELENAQWPEEASAAGKFARVKDRDHTLDCMEHVLSKRPRANSPVYLKRERTWLEEFVGPYARKKGGAGDAHLGVE